MIIFNITDTQIISTPFMIEIVKWFTLHHDQGYKG